MFLRKSIYLDLRSLALYRIFLGLLVLSDLILRSRDLIAHYTDQGILPRSVLIENFLNIYRFSVYLISGNEYIISGLFIFTGFLCVLLILGIRSNFVVFLIWIMTISLHNRIYEIGNLGDRFLGMILFWSIFLPLGERFSLESSISKKRKTIVRNTACLAYMLQVSVMYVFTVFHKNHPEWNQNFTALYFTLNLDFYTTYFGSWISQFHKFCRVLTFKTILIELIAPLLLFIPFQVKYLRSVAIFLIFSLHLGILFTMNIGIFPFICFTAWLPFIPREFWQYLFKKNWIKETHLKLSKNKIKLLPQNFLYDSLWRKLKIKKFVTIFLYIHICLMFYVSYAYLKKTEIPKSIEIYKNIINFEQNWSMFAPAPKKETFWFVFDGLLSDGTPIDPFLNKKGIVSYERPKSVSSYFPNNRWRRFLLNLTETSFEKHRLYFGGYLCKRYNSKLLENEPKLHTFTINIMMEVNIKENERTPLKKVTIWSHRCY